jgi:uncharacterized protein YbjT (DUF2867 family)
MQGKTAVVVGASGLIGRHLVQQLLNDPDFGNVRILVRQPLGLQHPKLQEQIVNFNDLDDLSTKTGSGDCFFCCVGTTRKKVSGDKTAYRKVDYDIPIHTARLAVQQGFNQYLLVSAVGANPVAANFYLQLKGSVEEDIVQYPFMAIHIFRPSMLLGNRNEFRLGERIGQVIMQATKFLLIGSLRKYRPIHGAQVAAAMITAAKNAVPGVHVYQFEEMSVLSSS